MPRHLPALLALSCATFADNGLHAQPRIHDQQLIVAFDKSGKLTLMAAIRFNCRLQVAFVSFWLLTSPEPSLGEHGHSRQG